MTEHTPPQGPDTATGAARPAAAAPATAGAVLRAAREAMGLSLDSVAQQLKLAPRQVVALEEDDYARLPGRTFVRGFLRNYARLVHVDPDKVLTALARGEAPALASPALQPTAPTMGELPAVDRGKPGWTRWAIPLALLAAIATAVIYEYSRGRVDGLRLPAIFSGFRAPETAAPTAPTGETPLPNPITEAPPEPKVAEPVAPAASDAVPTETAPGAATPATTAAPAAPATETEAPPAAASAAPSAEATLVLTFRDASWTEVKDGTGKVLVSQKFAGGQTRSIAGTPPFDVVIGNASEVSATFRGQPIDLEAVTRRNIARFILE